MAMVTPMNGTRRNEMTLALLRPSEAEVQRVMKEYKMDRLQAYHHVQGQMYLRKVKNPYPWGKSQNFCEAR